jgi:predicted  nucleic acid-binding Zn-ribbon protein
MQSSKALLGFGWAADAMKEPQLALVPWLELAQRDVSDSAALEAKIAVPYAYAKLEAYGQSLERYNDAIAAFERESTGLDESIAAVRSGKLVDALIERNRGDEMGWFQRLDDLPDLPHAGHLAPVLAQHEFQEAFKNYRDLLFLTQNLEEWHEKLGVFDDMLTTRRKAYADRLPQVRARASEIGLDAMRKRRDKVAAEVAAGEAQADGVAFANAKQLELLALVKSAQATLDKAPASAETEQARARLRLASGVLTWQLADDYTGRAWVAKKELVNIDSQIAQAQARDAALAQAQRDEPARFDAFGKRIAALDPLLQAMLPKVAALRREQQAVVQEIAVAELTHQKERLAIYATQARFAVAQLYDRANIKKDADHVAAPQ